jgi:hypothetical protein
LRHLSHLRQLLLLKHYLKQLKIQMRFYIHLHRHRRECYPQNRHRDHRLQRLDIQQLEFCRRSLQNMRVMLHLRLFVIVVT